MDMPTTTAIFVSTAIVSTIVNIAMNAWTVAKAFSCIFVRIVKIAPMDGFCISVRTVAIALVVAIWSTSSIAGTMNNLPRNSMKQKLLRQRQNFGRMSIANS